MRILLWLLAAIGLFAIWPFIVLFFMIAVSYIDFLSTMGS